MQTVEQLRKHIADRLELETSCVELMLESGYKLYDGSELGEVGLKIELVATCKTKCNIIFTALGLIAFMATIFPYRILKYVVEKILNRKIYKNFRFSCLLAGQPHIGLSLIISKVIN